MSYRTPRQFSKGHFHNPAPFAPPGVDPARTRQPECRTCGRPVVFVEMAATARLMPCDPSMTNGDGRRSIVVRWTRGKRVVGRVVARAGEDVVGLEPHWGTCEAARPGASRSPATPSRTAMRRIK